jgi:hypothetical protein
MRSKSWSQKQALNSEGNAVLELIQCMEGVDTVALQAQHPEFFNVTERDGIQRWTLRPRVRAALEESKASRFRAADRAGA